MNRLKDMFIHLLRLLAQILTAIRGQSEKLTEQPQAEQVDTTQEVITHDEPEKPAIVAHRLTGVAYHATPNQSGDIVPKFLIIHYTANGSLAGTIKHFQKSDSSASAHLIIGHDGEIVQMVDFNRKAWHVGKSQWGNLWALNEQSIGIELVNWGPLTPSGNKLLPWTRQESDAVDGVYAVQRPRPFDGKMMWWETYTDEQLEVCFNLAREVVREYTLLDVLGHEDVSPGRKFDPGPAFPLRALRAFCYSEMTFDEMRETWEPI
jgi:N-acetylmuramoyl-L-alanine amidase